MAGTSTLRAALRAVLGRGPAGRPTSKRMLAARRVVFGMA
jgi:hypothetical protein